MNSNDVALFSFLLCLGNFPGPSLEDLIVLLLVVCIGFAFISLLVSVALLLVNCNLRSVVTHTRFIALGVMLVFAKAVADVAIRRADATSPFAWIAVILASS